MVYYDRDNKLTSSQVFFHFHEYIEDFVANDVLFRYMIFDILYYIAVGFSMFMFVNIGFWWKILLLLPIMVLEHCVAFVYFYLYPKHRSKNQNTSAIEMFIDKIESRVSYWDNKDSYDSVFSWTEIDNLTRYYRNWAKEEREYLRRVEKEQRKKKNQIPAETNTTQDVRVVKLQNYRQEITYYVENHNISSISCVGDAIDNLLGAVNQKSAGVKLISNNLFVYFNELKYILEKYITLNNENKEKYNITITEIAERLSANIEEICDNIEKFETDDIEVSMSVLLKELKESKNLEITDTQTQLLNVENDIFNEVQK